MLDRSIQVEENTERPGDPGRLRPRNGYRRVTVWDSCPEGGCAGGPRAEASKGRNLFSGMMTESQVWPEDTGLRKSQEGRWA